MEKRGEQEVKVFLDGKEAPMPYNTGYLSIRESWDGLITTATLSFTDNNSLLSDLYPLVQNTVIEFIIGDEENQKSWKFYPFTQYSDGKMAQSDVYDVKLDLISIYAKPFLFFQEFKSMYGRASDFVKYIAGKCNLKCEVEDTKEKRNWINPNWKASQFLRYLAYHATSASGSSGYVYFIRYDGVLIFKSVDKLFEEARDIEDVDIIFDGETVRKYSVARNLFSAFSLGSNQVDIFNFDLDKNEKVVEKITQNDHISKYARFRGYPKEFKELYLSSSTFTNRAVKTTLKYNKESYKKSLLQLEATKVILTLRTDVFKRRIGSVISLGFPNKRGEANLPYAGRYVIKSINTIGTDDLYQRCTLVRPGINLLDRVGIE